MIDVLGGWLFPPSCFGCGAETGFYLCADCRSALAPVTVEVHGVTIQTLGDYHGPVGRSVKAIKRRGQLAVGRELTEMAVERVRELWSSERITAVMGLPPSREGFRYRGFSLPKLLEDQVCRCLGWSAIPGEDRSRFTVLPRSSRGLSARQRQHRLPESRTADESNAPRPKSSGTLLLLDDVITTGATMGQAIQTARGLGYSQTLAFCLAGSRAEESPGHLDLRAT